MKKIILFLALILTIICLTACDPNEFRYRYDELKEKTIRIELIDYKNPDAKELFEKRDKVISFDFDKMEIIETLGKEQSEDFLQDISKIVFMEYWRHYDSPNGISLRLVYDNGDFVVISQYDKFYTGSFNADGTIKRFIGGLSGKKDFVDLINKFFTTQI